MLFIEYIHTTSGLGLCNDLLQSLIKILKKKVTAQIPNPRLFRGWVQITFNLKKSVESSATQDILDTVTHMLEILEDHGTTARLALSPESSWVDRNTTCLFCHYTLM